MTVTDPGAPRRRTVLAAGAATATAAATTAAAAGTAAAATTAAAAAAPAAAAPNTRKFRHGVASGDPLPTAVILWTRVTPTPEATPGSGRGPRVKVTWQVATDRRFRRIVAHGTQRTGPARDHTVKVDATGLRPGRWYYYRFKLGRATSPVGRTRTAPAAAATPRNLRFGVVSCSNLQAGYFHSYRELAARTDLHAVLHLGDYLYEYGNGQYGYGPQDRDIRPHHPAHEMVTLTDYRQRHAQYKQDPDLRALHAKVPFIVTWDDHEVTNDAWRDGAENHDPVTEGLYRVRKRLAHRAYDEWMPVRMNGTAKLDGLPLYRRLTFGRLLDLTLLDLRSYRDQAPTDGSTGGPQTITGADQMAWLTRGLSASRAQWKLFGNSVMITPVDFGTMPEDWIDPVGEATGSPILTDGIPYNVDQWDGYVGDRRRLLRHIRDHQIKDVVFLTGDIHSGWACELPQDAGTYPANDRTLGVEFVCTSVTSNNLKDIVGSTALSPLVTGVIKAANPYIKYLDFDSHGFCVLDVTSARTQMDWYVVGDRATRDPGPARHAVSYRTAAGSSRLAEVATPVKG